MKVLLGTKEYMTQIFTKEGVVVPVTVIKTGPNKIISVKTMSKDGYEAIQVGYGEKREALFSKALKGHLKESGFFRFIKEFRNWDASMLPKVGSEINSDQFAEGQHVTVSGTSKGKGFQGVVKRHGFAGGPRSHGQKHSERRPGSIGAQGPQRVLKGLRMAGRMGSDRITIKNLVVAKIDVEAGLIYIKGAVPGIKGSLVEIVA